MGGAKAFRSTALLAVFLGCGCSAPVDIGAASGAGKKFHDEFNQRSYDRMYQEADPKFRAAVEPEAWSKLMTRLHHKLGNVTDTTRTGFNVNYNVGGSTVTMTYSTKFQLGDGQEEFVWLKSNHELRLLRYNVRSPALDEANVQ
jgi:uncharacterized protein DUF4019